MADAAERWREIGELLDRIAGPEDSPPERALLTHVAGALVRRRREPGEQAHAAELAELAGALAHLRAPAAVATSSLTPARPPRRRAAESEGQRLVRQLVERHGSVAAVGRLAGVTATVLSRWRTGKAKPTARSLERLRGALEGKPSPQGEDAGEEADSG